MKESRGNKYGRFLASVIYSLTQSYSQENYQILISELNNFSFKPRKKGEPKNDGCVWELKDLIQPDVDNPENLARIVKEGIHLMYQKGTQRRVIQALLDNLPKHI
ncbi:hypothetical protein ACFLZB_01225 [Nanoarchaeota archaeon]